MTHFSFKPIVICEIVWPVCSSTTCSVLICISLSLWLLFVSHVTVTIPKQTTILHTLEHMWYSKVRHTWCAPPTCLKEGLKHSLCLWLIISSLHNSITFYCSKIKMFRLTILGKVSVCIRFVGRHPPAGIVRFQY